MVRRERIRRATWWIIGLAALLIAAGLTRSSPARAGGVVGGACDEAAFTNALIGGGLVTFNCGPNPAPIVLSNEKVITQPTTIDGGGVITLDGSNTTRLLRVTGGGALTVTNITLMRGSGRGAVASGFGGAIYNNGGSLTVLSSTLQLNNTFNNLPGTGGPHEGGAINNTGPLTIRNSRFLSNTATGGGGFVSIGTLIVESSLFRGNAAVTNYGGAFQSSSTGLIRSSDFISNTAFDLGGGIAGFVAGALTIESSRILSNALIGPNTALGAGLYSAGAVTVTDSTIAGNLIPAGAAGGRTGAGMRSEGRLVMRRSSVIGNTSPGTGGLSISAGSGTTLIDSSSIIGNSGRIGGMETRSSAPVNVVNSTLSGNSGAVAGGLDIDATPITLTNVSLVDNVLTGPGASAYALINAILTLHNTVIRSNAPECSSAGTVLSRGGNWATSPSCEVVTSNNILFGAPANNGGPTLNNYPQAGSVTIDGGVAPCPATDQRGARRPRGAGCDSGAIEAGATPTLAGLNPGSVGVGAPSFQLIATGADFLPGAVIQWNGEARPTTFISPTRLTALIPAINLTAPITAQVNVRNPGPGDGASPSLPFQVAGAAVGFVEPLPRMSAPVFALARRSTAFAAPTNVAGATLETESTVYAGGTFTTAGGNGISFVAQLDPLTLGWNAIGGGTNGPVLALATNGSTLYAGGGFSEAGGQSASFIAQYNEVSGWNALSGGTNGNVNTLASFGSGVIAGGVFSQAGGQPAGFVATFNPVSGWNALGGGTDGPVLAAATSGTNAVVGGSFSQAGGVTSTNIALWNGTGWNALAGGGTNGPVQSLTVSGTQLIVGGAFSQAGGQPASNVALYDLVSGTWNSLGSGTNGAVNALSVNAGTLFAGGAFTVAGGQPVGYLARWDGTTWASVGTGANDPVFALLANGPSQYVGGAFTQIDGLSAGYIARFGPPRTVFPRQIIVGAFVTRAIS